MRDEGSDDGTALQVIEATSLGAMTRAEIDVQIATAKQYRRDIKRSLKQAADMACMTPEMAQECCYALPRDGKSIEGASIRLAEILAGCWGNLRVGARTVEIGEKFVVAQGVCFDLETNVAFTSDVRRRIAGKTGRRFGDDMIGVTANAAQSIALRNVVLRCIPKPLWWPIYGAAKIRSRESRPGDAPQIAEQAVAWWQRKGLPLDRILDLLGVAKIGEISQDQLDIMFGWKTALDSGELTIESLIAGGSEEGAATESAPTSPMPKASPLGDSGHPSIEKLWREWVSVKGQVTEFMDQICRELGVPKITWDIGSTKLARAIEMARQLVPPGGAA